MLSGQAPSSTSAPLPRFLPVFGLRFLYCTTHPSGSRSSGNPPAGEKEQNVETSTISQNVLCSFEPETPVRFCGPRKSSVPGRVQKGSVFMVEYQHCMAHGVVSKDEELGFMSGVERLTNQPPGLLQLKNGFPVPARPDYRNILSSLNST
jgi:hypothetical protein